MNNYKCKNCPETMISKCPATRNTFPDHTLVTMLSNFMLVKTKPYNEVSPDLCLVMEWGHFPAETSARKMLAEMVRTMRSLTDEEAEILVCDHEWEKVECTD